MQTVAVQTKCTASYNNEQWVYLDGNIIVTYVQITFPVIPPLAYHCHLQCYCISHTLHGQHRTQYQVVGSLARVQCTTSIVLL